MILLRSSTFLEHFVTSRFCIVHAQVSNHVSFTVHLIGRGCLYPLVSLSDLFVHKHSGSFDLQVSCTNALPIISLVYSRYMPFPLSRCVSDKLQLIAGRNPKLLWYQCRMTSKRASDGNKLQARMCDTPGS
ncbi:TPA: hypothetical protein ACH3X1_008494 [Trebouxia sp. C0004]